MKYILSGGGTGGHIYPALAIANEIKNRDKNADILYIGTKNGLEAEIVPKAGFNFKAIDVKGLPRKKVNVETVKTLLALYKGLRQCEKIISEFKPDIVIGTGGYVCAPIVLKAQQKHIPTVIQEQNAYPGKTNKYLAKRASLIALNFKEAKKYFNEKNVIFTGNPIRSNFEHISKEEALKKLSYEGNIKTVLSFGGSGGQESTNEAVIEIIKSKKNLDFRFIHITGKVHYESFMNAIKDIELPKNIIIKDYSFEIPDLLMISDLVVASSSAMTLAEISAVGLPSILIPKAYTAGNHQVFNAKSYAEKGASQIIYEDKLNGELLFEKITALLKDDDKLKEMGKNAKSLGNISAVKELVDNILKVVD